MSFTCLEEKTENDTLFYNTKMKKQYQKTILGVILTVNVV